MHNSILAYLLAYTIAYALAYMVLGRRAPSPNVNGASPPRLWGGVAPPSLRVFPLCGVGLWAFSLLASSVQGCGGPLYLLFFCFGSNVIYIHFYVYIYIYIHIYINVYRYVSMYVFVFRFIYIYILYIHVYIMYI